MRAVVCWGEITGYMAACWRELVKQSEVDLLVLASHSGTRNPNAPFDRQITDGIPCRLLDRNMLSDPGAIAEVVLSFKPDIVYVSGWDVSSYVRLAFHPRLAAAHFILGLDNPREDTWRQRLARFKIRRYLDRMDRVVVPGERSWQLARNLLKVPESKLRRGLYGIDYDAFSRACQLRQAETCGWPRRFLFAGRYEPVKGLDVLLSAYGAYRRRVRDPWPLTCCGKGSLAPELSKVEGVENLGFVQPDELPAVLARHGVFVLPSRREPWGAVLAEAGAAELPIVCTESCGAAVEIVRPYFNGLIIPTGDVDAMTEALCWMHEHQHDLPAMGRRSRQLAEPYSAQMWVVRWVQMFKELLPSRSDAAA